VLPVNRAFKTIAIFGVLGLIVGGLIAIGRRQLVARLRKRRA